jgi:predicted phosphodiesterase
MMDEDRVTTYTLKNNGNPYHKEHDLRQIKVAVISDTHKRQDELNIPEADVLLHCGDFTIYRDWTQFSEQCKNENLTLKQKLEILPKSIVQFNEFLGCLKHAHKIVILGNHDSALRVFTKDEIQKHVLSNCTYLSDSSVSLFDGQLNIYGTSWDNKEKWTRIPLDMDILMTHEPPYGICDHNTVDYKNIEGLNDTCQLQSCPLFQNTEYLSSHHEGDRKLLSRMKEISSKESRVRVHVFGHEHYGYGHYKDVESEFKKIDFINAAK